MTTSDLTNKNQTALLHALAASCQKRAADAMGVHESTISRMKGPDADIERFAIFAAALGLKLVGADEQTYRPAIVIRALHTMAGLGFELAPEMAAIRGATN
jgi:hypothetical protein